MQPVGHPLLHQQARARTADLPLVEPDGIDQPLDRTVQIGVVKDDKGRLAAQLQRQRLARAGGGGADPAADLGRAGKGDLVDPLMRNDHLAHAPVAGNDVDDTARQPGLDA